jgi:hypothetical protein
MCMRGLITSSAHCSWPLPGFHVWPWVGLAETLPCNAWSWACFSTLKPSLPTLFFLSKENPSHSYELGTERTVRGLWNFVRTGLCCSHSHEISTGFCSMLQMNSQHHQSRRTTPAVCKYRPHESRDACGSHSTDWSVVPYWLIGLLQGQIQSILMNNTAIVCK